MKRKEFEDFFKQVQTIWAKITTAQEDLQKLDDEIKFLEKQCNRANIGEFLHESKGTGCQNMDIDDEVTIKVQV